MRFIDFIPRVKKKFGTGRITLNADMIEAIRVVADTGEIKVWYRGDKFPFVFHLLTDAELEVRDDPFYEDDFKDDVMEVLLDMLNDPNVWYIKIDDIFNRASLYRYLKDKK